MKTLIKNFLFEENAATAVEYSVMLGVIVLVCIVAIVQLGGESLSFWNRSADAVSSALND